MIVTFTDYLVDLEIKKEWQRYLKLEGLTQAAFFLRAMREYVDEEKTFFDHLHNA